MDIGSIFVISSDFSIKSPQFIHIECLCSFCCISLPTCQSLLICVVTLGHLQIRCPAPQPGHFASVQESWDKGYPYWAMTTCYCIDQSLSLDSLCLRCTKARPTSTAGLHPALNARSVSQSNFFSYQALFCYLELLVLH